MKITTGNPTISLNYPSRESLLSANADLIAQIQFCPWIRFLPFISPQLSGFSGWLSLCI
jgi:hypothetical protein